MRSNAFKSKLDAMNRRTHSWWCLICDTRYFEKRRVCECGSRDLHYFPSEAEARRFATLKLELRCKQITDLQLQPVFPIVINGKLVTKYKADFKYKKQDGTVVVEDVKGSEDYTTDVFKLKRKLVEAAYSIRLTIV